MRMTGHVLTGLGLAWIVVDRLLRHFLPAWWSGPNIGGGFLLLLAYGSIVIGLVLLVGSFVPRPRTLRPRPDEPRPTSRRRLGPWIVNGVLLALIALSPFLFPAYSYRNTIAGRMGVTVDAAGNPILVLEICRSSIDRISLVGPNVNARNEPLALLMTPAPVTATMLLDPLHPPEGWTGTPDSLPYSTDPDLLHISSGRGRSSLTQVSFTRASLAGLDPQTVQYSGWDVRARRTTDERVPLADFHAVVCDPLLAG